MVAGSIRCANTTSPLPFGTKRGRILRSDETENKPAHRPISLPPDGLHFVACAPRENESGKNLAGESFAVGQEEEEVSEREKDSFYAFLDNLAGLHPFGFRATSVGKLEKSCHRQKCPFSTDSHSADTQQLVKEEEEDGKVGRPGGICWFILWTFPYFPRSFFLLAFFYYFCVVL